MCNVIPILYPFFFIPSLYLPFFNLKIFYFLVSVLFYACMHAYIKFSGFIGDKGPRPLKKLLLFQKKGKVSMWTLHRYMYSSPETSCYWQQTCNVAMVMKIVDKMCLQSFMIIDITNNNL